MRGKNNFEENVILRSISTSFDPPLLNASTSSPPFLKFASWYIQHFSAASVEATTLSRTAPGSKGSPLDRCLPMAEKESNLV